MTTDIAEADNNNNVNSVSTEVKNYKYCLYNLWPLRNKIFLIVGNLFVTYTACKCIFFCGLYIMFVFIQWHREKKNGHVPALS